MLRGIDEAPRHERSNDCALENKVVLRSAIKQELDEASQSACAQEPIIKQEPIEADGYGHSSLLGSRHEEGSVRVPQHHPE